MKAAALDVTGRAEARRDRIRRSAPNRATADDCESVRLAAAFMRRYKATNTRPHVEPHRNTFVSAKNRKGDAAMSNEFRGRASRHAAK